MVINIIKEVKFNNPYYLLKKETGNICISRANKVYIKRMVFDNSNLRKKTLAITNQDIG